MTDRETRHILITGRVHGVGFRAFVADQARQRDLSGWTRNRSDGGVEVLVTGPHTDVAAIVEACMEGPRSAKVERVEELAPIEPASGPFTILNDL